MLRKTTEAEWTCPACTLINQKDSRRCSACDHEFKSKKFVLIPSFPTTDKNNNTADNSKYSLIRSTINNLLSGFGGTNNNNNNENNQQQQQQSIDHDIIEIDPITNKPVRKKSNEPKILSNNLWVCQVCSYSMNTNWNSKCEMCFSDQNRATGVHGPSTSSKKVVDTTTTTTTTKTSTEKNSVSKNKADDSTVYDNSLNEDIYDYARIWTCKFCTFINFNKDIQCELCLTPRLNNLKASKTSQILPINKPASPQETPVPIDQWVIFNH